LREAMRDGIERVAALPVPTVALIHGPCFGAGVALAMACDLRLVGREARFAITPAKFGISYPQEDIARLVGLVGPGQASRLLLGAQPIDGGEALRIGLAEGRLEEAGELVQAIRANSPASLATLKAGIALAARGGRSDRGRDEGFDTLLASDGLAERLAALRRRG
jgi:enoyl-CoA hydratase/carnithine racemase